MTNSKYKIMAAKAVVVGDLEDTVVQGKGWYVWDTGYITGKINLFQRSLNVLEPWCFVFRPFVIKAELRARMTLTLGLVLPAL